MRGTRQPRAGGAPPPPPQAPQATARPVSAPAAAAAPPAAEGIAPADFYLELEAAAARFKHNHETMEELLLPSAAGAALARPCGG
jgi:hypothetical protein